MSDVQERTAQAGDPAAEADGVLQVENPATGEIIATVAALDAAAVAELARLGRAAQPAWEALGFEGRGRVLRRMQRWVMDNAARITKTIVSETGKTWEDAQTAEISYGANAFGFWAKNAERWLSDERVRSASVLVAGKRLLVRYRPLCLVGVIGPWNYPFTNSFGDCIPALAAGNSAILKPSEVTPLTSLLLLEGMLECGLPEHVLQVATGRGDTGAALIDEVDMIMFTGSTRTGRKVAQQAAGRLIPCSLELGGNDPLIVLADADVERAANLAVYYSMQNAGQTCISIERAYVEAPVYDEFVAKVTAKVRALRQGRSDGGPGTVEVGATTFAPQLEIVAGQVDDAVAKGARVLVGGHRGAGPGRWYEPTVLVDVDHSMAIMHEETFGPTLPIMKVADADEAVRLANDSQYGLGASVVTRDTARGEEIARRIEAGAVDVNDAAINYIVLELPMGGVKSSGLGGARHGAGGIRKYTAQQSILITPRLTLRREPHMFPYTRRRTLLIGRLFKLLYGRGGRD